MTEILSFISVLIIMLLLRSLVSIFPSLVACLVRSKESFNLEASVKLSRNRDLLALAMIVPFCLVAMRFRFKGVGMIDTMSNDIQTLIIIGCFIVYILFRLAVQNLFRPHSIAKKTYETAAKASRTFFIILTLVLLCAGGIISLFDFDMMASRNAMLWISAIIYGLFLVRKFQIFISSCSIFTAFLYLCALEIIPTGTLVVSAIIL